MHFVKSWKSRHQCGFVNRKATITWTFCFTLVILYTEMACFIVNVECHGYVYNKVSEESTWEKYLDDWRQLHLGSLEEALPEENVVDHVTSEILLEDIIKEEEVPEEAQPKYPAMKTSKCRKMNFLDEVNALYLNDPLYKNEYPDLKRLLETYKEQFINLDVEGKGYLETNALENIMKRHTRVSHSEVKKMVGELDREDRGCITYHDFLHNMLVGEKSVLQNTLKFAIATKMIKAASSFGGTRDIGHSPSPSPSPKHAKIDNILIV